MSAKLQKALLVKSEGNPFTLGIRPIPKPGHGQSLVKIISTAVNPVDRHMQSRGYFVTSYPIVCGLDAAGVVEDVGADVQGFAKGDRVVYQGNFTSDRDTFQEYGLTDAVITAKIPSNVSFDEASTLPLALVTAAMGYYAELKLRGGAGLLAPWEENGRGKYHDEPVLIIGGSSSVGQFAIQLAKMSGFNPIISTASSHNEDYCKAAGATHVIDYNKMPYSALRDAVASITTKPIKMIYDSISIPDSQTASWSLLSPGGKLVVTRPPSDSIGKLGEEDKEGKRTIWVYGSSSEPEKGDARLAKSLFASLEKMMKEGYIKPNKVDILEGGLSGISGGLERMGAGKVSGVKLVARIADTP